MASSISATNTAAVLLEARSRSMLMAAIAMHNIANVATPRAADRDWVRGCSEGRTVPEPGSRVKPYGVRRARRGAAHPSQAGWRAAQPGGTAATLSFAA